MRAGQRTLTVREYHFDYGLRLICTVPGTIPDGAALTMPKISKILLLAVSVVLVVAVFLGVNSNGVSAATEPQDGAYRQINVYSEVLRHIQTDYVEQPNITAVTNGALRGLLESLDADSSYLTPEDYKAYKADKGGKAQVGINVSKRYGYASVVSVVPGSPADKADSAMATSLRPSAGGHARYLAGDDPVAAGRAAGHRADAFRGASSSSRRRTRSF